MKFNVVQTESTGIRIVGLVNNKLVRYARNYIVSSFNRNKLNFYLNIINQMPDSLIPKLRHDMLMHLRNYEF